MRFSLITIGLIVTHLAFSQSKELDSLYTTLKNHPQADTVRANLLFQICYREYTSSPEQNKVHATEALRISNALNFKKGIVFATRYVALYYWSTGDYQQAAKYAYDMLQTAEQTKFNQGIGMANQLLGLIYELTGNFDKSNTYYKNALEIYKKMNRKKHIGYAYNSLGSLNFTFKKYDKAFQYFLKSLEVRKEINDEDGLSQTYGNIAHIYVIQKKYNEARAYFDKAQHILEKMDNQYRIATNYTGMGEMYMSLGEFNKAEKYLLSAIDVAKKMNHKILLQKTFNSLMALEKSRGQFESALKYFELTLSYRDSIFSEEKEKKIAEAEANFETTQKDYKIKLLEQDTRLRQFSINILIGILIMLTVLALVIYYFQRLNQRKDEKILNLKIEALVHEKKELSEKFKEAVTSPSEQTIDSLDQRILKKALDVIEAHVGDPLFGVEKMSKEMGMSRTNLHRKIKAITGLPPSDLIRTYRMKKAAALLLSQANSVSQIGFIVGFEDHSYFSKSFKKQFGVPPSEYFHSKKQVLN
jgi:AraC-like DNA-binding protein